MSTTFPNSRFLSVDKDMAIIVDKILSSNNLKKLLYYSTPDCLQKPALSESESIGLLNTYIKVVPKIYIDPDLMTYIIIKFTNFFETPSNPQFRHNRIFFEIVCHYSAFLIDDMQMRPYRIAAEIDSVLDKKRLTGIGVTKFDGANLFHLNDEYCGLELGYLVTHGEEDKKNPLNPEMELFDE